MIWTYKILQFIFGCAVLAWSAKRFILASEAIAQNLKLSSFMVGVLLVGFGTSFPEMIVSAIAAIHGNPNLAIGNAIGSNIINVGLVLGLIIVVTPLTIHSRLLQREYPLMLGIAFLVWLLIWNDYLSRIDGLILIFLLAVYLYWMFFFLPKKARHVDVVTEEYRSEMEAVTIPMTRAIIWWLVGLVLLLISSEILVNAATGIARLLRVDELIIGLTIVALGTSLPELSASMVGALRGKHDLAIGNVVGSNIFNLLGVLAFPALISPTRLPSNLLYRDYPVMMMFMVVLGLFLFAAKPKNQLRRWMGVVFLIGLILYLCLLIYMR